MYQHLFYHSNSKSIANMQHHTIQSIYLCWRFNNVDSFRWHIILVEQRSNDCFDNC